MNINVTAKVIRGMKQQQQKNMQQLPVNKKTLFSRNLQQLRSNLHKMVGSQET